VDGLYQPTQYENELDGSLDSARVVVPLVLKVFPCTSVLDIGCGIGTWLKAFDENGVHEHIGYDGNHVTRDMLLISSESFRPCDLRFPPSIDRRFDIACSLEVAEHLPDTTADALVTALVRAAPVVVFSAAVPGQPGPGHINTQWQDYWAKLFIRHDYKPTDFLRPQIWGDPRVCWWYQQNVVVYCDPAHYPAGHRAPRSLNMVHPSLYSMPIGGKRAIRLLGQSVKRRAVQLYSRSAADKIDA
jgi:SAM-dependent methyltransferase